MFSRSPKEEPSNANIPKRTVFIGRAEYALLFDVSLTDVDRMVFEGCLHAQVSGTILVVEVDAEEVAKRRASS